MIVVVVSAAGSTGGKILAWRDYHQQAESAAYHHLCIFCWSLPMSDVHHALQTGGGHMRMHWLRIPSTITGRGDSNARAAERREPHRHRAKLAGQIHISGRPLMGGPEFLLTAECRHFSSRRWLHGCRFSIWRLVWHCVGIFAARGLQECVVGLGFNNDVDGSSLSSAWYSPGIYRQRRNRSQLWP